MNDLEKVKRHLGKPISITIKNSSGEEDTFNFKPLNIEQQAILMELSKNIQNRPKIKIEGKEVPDISKEDMKGMFDLILDICRNSLSDLNEETLVDFVNTNFEQISSQLDLLIGPMDKKPVDLIKKRQEALKDAKAK